jgi:hypothetical protein
LWRDTIHRAVGLADLGAAGNGCPQLFTVFALPLRQEGPAWVLSGVLILAMATCPVAIIRIVREARHPRDPYGRFDLIPMAHEGRLIPDEGHYDRED